MAMPKQLEDWQNLKPVLERNEVMLSQQLATDVTFSLPVTIGGDETQTIGAHKYMLIASSQVFWTMFCGGFEEKSGDNIDIKDIEFDTFKEVLSFIYTERLNLTRHNVIRLLHAANKYMIGLIKQKCIKFLEWNLDQENVCQILEQYLLLNETELASNCFKIIQKQTKLVLKSDGFKQISRATLMQILDAKEVNVPEYKIFKACLAWAKHKSGDSAGADVLREHLGEALYKICIPAMSTEELGRYITPTGILTEKEELLCYRFASKSQLPLDMPFTKEPRKITGAEQLALRDFKSGKQFSVSTFKNLLQCSGQITNNSKFPVRINKLLVVAENNVKVRAGLSLFIEQLQSDADGIGEQAQVEVCKSIDGFQYAKIKLDCGLRLDPKVSADYHISYTKLPSLNAGKTLQCITESSSTLENFEHNIKLQANRESSSTFENFEHNIKLLAKSNWNDASIDGSIITFIPLIGVICVDASASIW